MNCKSFKLSVNKEYPYEIGEVVLLADKTIGEQLYVYDGRTLIPLPKSVDEEQRLRDGIKFALENTQDDETWDYLNHLLQGTESESMYHRFDTKSK